MLKTFEVKRIALIMFKSNKPTESNVRFIIKQLQMMPDTVRANFEVVKEYLDDLLKNEQLKGEIKK
ncbi:MAG: hypothetical protein WC390_11860 [Sulfurimonas sp.]|jgi:hypothetical protein